MSKAIAHGLFKILDCHQAYTGMTQQKKRLPRRNLNNLKVTV
jgi:hypothetical protein